MANTTDPQGMVRALRQTLADVVAFSMKTQGYHWNSFGVNFQQYHALFAGIYEDVSDSIDGIAENILKVGSYSPYHIQDLGSMTRIVPVPRPESCQAMAGDLYASNEIVINTLYECFDQATRSNQQGVADFIAGRIDMHQKWSWQLKQSAGLFRDVMEDGNGMAGKSDPNGADLAERVAEIKGWLADK